MRYEGWLHEWAFTTGYRVAVSSCKCGWFGKRCETLDEALLDYRQHVRETVARIR